MERHGYGAFFLFYFFSFVYTQNDVEKDLTTTTEDFLQPANLVLWPNGTIPFYINTDHFDNEQTLAIMSSLSLLAFRTCLRFAPAMVAPSADEHVLTLANPSGARKCLLRTDNEPHVLNLGYDCLKAPWLDRFVLRALGLPFEHNRANRDDYIDVQYENIEQHAIPLFTKDFKMPAALRALPYDINSVLHFGDRDFSKNGHRTIIFKDRETKQKREGMTELDIRKIEIVYGLECQKRDRMEKIELCHLYPGIPMARRKRSAELETTRSLRVNPDITPPPEIDKIALNISDEVLENIRNLDIDDEVQYILDDVHRLSVKALKNARIKYCNDTDDLRRAQRERTDVLGIIKVVANYAQSMVDHAVYNLTSFCEKSESVAKYQRYNCATCYTKYYSTNHGVPFHSTKNRPYIQQSTKHVGGYSKPPYDAALFRAHADDNDTVVKDETAATGAVRKRRQLDDTSPDLLKESEHYVSATEAMRPLERFKRGAYYDEPRNRRRTRPVSVESGDSGDKVYVSDSGSESSSSSEDRGNMQNKWPKRQEIGEKWRQKEIKRDDRDDLKTRERKGKQRERPATEESAEELREKDTVEYIKDTKSGGRINNDVSEEEKQRNPPLSEIVTEDKRFEKDTVEVYSSEPKRWEREGKRPRKKPKIEDWDEERREKDTVENRDERQSGEREGKRPTKKPKIEDWDEERREKDTVENRDERQSGERKGKMQKKRPLSEDSQEKSQGEDSEGSSDETDTGKRDVKRDKKRPASEDVQEPRLEQPDDDDNDENYENVALRTLEMTKENEDFYQQRRWPDGIVRYFIDRTSTVFDVALLRKRLALVNEILRKRTCVRIVEIRDGEKSKFEDYLVLDNSPDYVTGRVGGPQNFGSVELLKGGQHRQHTAMMVMAMLGFYFELARHDRDEYIKVHMRHVRPDKLHHFEKLGEEATLPLPFDYKSATMPAWMFWRKTGRTGISTVATYKDKDPDGKMMKSFGQNRKLLSEGDIIKINTLYGTKCMTKDKEEEPQDTGSHTGHRTQVLD